MTRRAPEADPSQFVLPLFGDEEPVSAPPAPRALQHKAPLAPAPSPAVVSAHAQSAAVFRHPRADREIQLGDVLVGYEFQRARRRTIGMVVAAEGLSVRAPRWVTLADVEAALLERSKWIRNKLAEQRERARRHEASRIEWRDGACLPFLGETVIVVLDARAAGAVLNTDAMALPGVPRLTLHVGLPHNAAPEQIRDVVQSWLQRQAKRVFEERCQLFAQRLGVRVKRLALSSAQTRWGSASADGSIRLNWRLVHFAVPTIDYVVAHELAHLRHMDHSPRFWDVVRSVIPDVEAVRGRLKDEVLPTLE
jgi:predicted metal-dependent hydrolase